VPDQGNAVTDGHDVRRRTRLHQLGLEELLVEVLELVELRDGLDPRPAWLSGLRAEPVEVACVDQAGGDGVALELRPERVDLFDAQRRRVERRCERPVHGDQGRQQEVGDQDDEPRVDEDAEEAVDAAHDRHSVDHAADLTAEEPGHHGHDQGQEDVEHGVGVEELLHRRRVGLLVSDDHEQGAQEEDLDQQRLNHAAAVADPDCDQECDDDCDVDEHQPARAILLMAGPNGPL
jgi:hypothetical protein